MKLLTDRGIFVSVVFPLYLICVLEFLNFMRLIAHVVVIFAYLLRTRHHKLKIGMHVVPGTNGVPPY